jgi:adenosylcobinamide-GDP ribazoletransferase
VSAEPSVTEPTGPTDQTEPTGRGRAVDVLSDGLRLAIGTLTAVRVRPPHRIDRRVAAAGMLLAPVAGLVPALAAAVTCAVAVRIGASSWLAAAMAIGVVALATRGLHLDGLADTADGLTAGYKADRGLAVMRRGDTGPAGAASVVLVLMVQVGALAQALVAIGPVAAAIGVLAGRATLPVICSRGIPAARPEGLGAAVAGTVPRTAAAAVLVAVAACCGLAAGWTPGGPGWANGGPGLAHGAGTVLFGAAVAGLLLERCRRRFGGITGDVLGACVEASTTAALVGLALAW